MKSASNKQNDTDAVILYTSLILPQACRNSRSAAGRAVRSDQVVRKTALPPTAALMSIQKGQPLRAATRIRTIWTRFRPMAHRPQPKIMLDMNEASIARDACA
jgi:hypothetical protein